MYVKLFQRQFTKLHGSARILEKDQNFVKEMSARSELSGNSDNISIVKRKAEIKTTEIINLGIFSALMQKKLIAINLQYHLNEF